MNFEEEKYQTKAKLNNALMPRELSREAGANKGGVSRVVRIRCFFFFFIAFFQDTFLVGVTWASTDSTEGEREGVRPEHRQDDGLSQGWCTHTHTHCVASGVHVHTVLKIVAIAHTCTRAHSHVLIKVWKWKKKNRRSPPPLCPLLLPSLPPRPLRFLLFLSNRPNPSCPPTAPAQLPWLPRQADAPCDGTPAWKDSSQACLSAPHLPYTLYS